MTPSELHFLNHHRARFLALHGTLTDQEREVMDLMEALGAHIEDPSLPEPVWDVSDRLASLENHVKLMYMGLAMCHLRYDAERALLSDINGTSANTSGNLIASIQDGTNESGHARTVRALRAEAGIN